MNQQPNYELLREAYAIIGGIPARKFNLEAIITQRGESLECGTIACAAGWLALHPKFQGLGLGTTMDLNREHAGRPLHVNSIPLYFEDAMAQVFQISADDARELFGTRGMSYLDDDLPFQRLSDKALWKARVKAYLRERGQLTSQLEAAKA